MAELDFKSLHVLVVDDDATTRQLIRTVLTATGSQVTVAATGSDAVFQLLEAQRVVDVILCDYNMPAGNGLQLLQAIRTSKVKYVRPDTCFIMITSEGAAETIKLAGQLDVNGYLLKPVTAAKLKASIEKGRSKYIAVDFARYGAVPVPSTPAPEPAS